MGWRDVLQLLFRWPLKGLGTPEIPAGVCVHDVQVFSAGSRDAQVFSAGSRESQVSCG